MCSIEKAGLKIGTQKFDDGIEMFLQWPHMRSNTVFVTHDDRGLWAIRRLWDHQKVASARSFQKAMRSYKCFLENGFWLPLY